MRTLWLLLTLAILAGAASPVVETTASGAVTNSGGSCISTATNCSSTSATIPFTVAGSGRLLVVMVIGVTTVNTFNGSYDGVPMTVTSCAAWNCWVLTLSNPHSGAHNLVLGFDIHTSGWEGLSFYVYSIRGAGSVDVRQSVQQDTLFAGSRTMSIAFTPGVANELALLAGVLHDGADIQITSPAATVVPLGGGNTYHLGAERSTSAYFSPVATGSNTYSANFTGTTDTSAFMVLTVKPPSGGQYTTSGGTVQVR